MGNFYQTKAYRIQDSGNVVEDYPDGRLFCLNSTDISCREVLNQSIIIYGHEIKTIMYDNDQKAQYFVTETMDEIYDELEEESGGGGTGGTDDITIGDTTLHFVNGRYINAT